MDWLKKNNNTQIENLKIMMVTKGKGEGSDEEGVEKMFGGAETWEMGGKVLHTVSVANPLKF